MFTDANLDIDGEYIRSNVIEDQQGVPVTLDMQFIDVETCEPVRDAVIEIWSTPPLLHAQDCVRRIANSLVSRLQRNRSLLRSCCRRQRRR